MGIHLCGYCYRPNGNGSTQIGFGNICHPSGSGDIVLLNEASGVQYEMPDLILHYVLDHQWLPPQEFVQEVMTGALKPVCRFQTKGLDITSTPKKAFVVKKIGYLEGSFETGDVPKGFAGKLEELMVASSPDFVVRYRF